MCHVLPVAAEAGPSQKMYGAGVVAMTVRSGFHVCILLNN